MKIFKNIFKKELEEVKGIYKNKNVEKNSKKPIKSTKSNDVEIVFYEPKSVTDIRKIAKDIINGKTTSINFHKFNKSQIEKYLQFLGGVIFTLNGAYFKKSAFEYFFSASKTIIANMQEK